MTGPKRQQGGEGCGSQDVGSIQILTRNSFLRVRWMVIIYFFLLSKLLLLETVSDRDTICWTLNCSPKGFFALLYLTKTID